MKILMAAPHANFMVGGGASIQLQETKKYLPRFGVNVDFFNPWQKYLPGEVDLVHIFGANITMWDLAMRLREFDQKFVVSTIFYTLHRPWFLRFARRVEKNSKRIFKGIWTDYAIISDICQQSDGVLPNTSEEALLVEKGFEVSPDKISIIPNGVDERFYHGDPELFTKTYGLENFILNVANIGSFRKNALSLIRALNQIDYPSVIIGKVFNNAYAKKCLQEARKNKRLKIIDALPYNSPMLESAYAACDVFVLPAYFETPGIAALEAALADSKIVITKFGGTKDYFKDQAVYINPHSVSSIKAGIEKSLTLKKNELLRERIRKEFLWPVVAEKNAAVYKKILER